MRIIILLGLATALLLASSVSHGIEVRKQRPNLFGGELGGRAILGVGYERYLNDRFGVGAAVGYVVALSISFVPVGNVHSLYLSASTLNDWSQSNSDEWVPGLTVAYQFQSLTGLFVRAGVTAYVVEDGLYPGPAVAVGGSF